MNQILHMHTTNPPPPYITILQLAHIPMVHEIPTDIASTLDANWIAGIIMIQCMIQIGRERVNLRDYTVHDLFTTRLRQSVM